MIEIELEEYPGIDAILDNIDYYKKKFLADAVFGFKNAYCDRSDQERIFQAFGDFLGWSPNTNNPSNVSNYEETHHNHMNQNNTASSNEYMLGWHVEHVTLKNDTYIGASWCMNLFQCLPGAGYTYFVDMLKLYNSLSDSDRQFLDHAIVTLTLNKGNVETSHDYPFIQPHWLLGSNVVRSHFTPNITKLKSISGADATAEQADRFSEIHRNILTQVYDNEDIRMVRKWQEGDMLILDMFRMAHAIGGGFNEGERKLNGIFGHSNVDWAVTKPEHY